MAIFNNPGGPPPVESEDCLYLNVFAPSTPAPAGGRTVLFWIYGGNLQFGTGGKFALRVSNPISKCLQLVGLLQYDGSSFAAHQDVIVVTHNYRTNGMMGS